MKSLRQFLQNPLFSGSFFAIGFVAFLASAVLTLMALIGRPNWAFNLAGHFQMQYLFIQVGAYLILQATGHRWLRFFALALASMNLVQIWPLLCPNPDSLMPAAAVQPKARVLQMNVWTKNENYSRAFEHIRQVKPDIIAVEEMDKKWAATLSTVLPHYGYNQAPIRETAEILLFSKFPVQSSEAPIFKASNHQYVVAKLDMGGHPVTVMVVHLVSPLDSATFERQDREYSELIELRKKFPGDFIIVGDFNATSWTRGFRRFMASADLTDSRIGRGIQPTWPTQAPLLAIPIDHCLVSRNFKVLNRFTGPHIGSDHLPVCIDLALSK
jgi:endonuclease/exonuclease/phosphatase (EEP) superfamily protein YafD